ncbi:MAG: rhomboid family intramembrane serine protease [Capsulimonadaceae bacterium]
MFFVLPLRVKNPPDRIPYITLTLIALNILVFVCTIQAYPGDGYLEIRNDVVDNLTVSHNQFTFFRLFTSMFLHANIEHILGNMWFLWLFGPSLESRLRPLKFISMYLLSGMLGGILEDVVEGYMNPNIHAFGASGAIMGLVGAYLYVFPCAPFKVFYAYWLVFIWPRIGIAEWYARWVALFFLAYDLYDGMNNRWLAQYHAGSGVAQFCHLGGALTGFLFVALLRVRRDSEDVSLAQAMRADTRDYDMLSYYELDALMQNPAEDMRLVVAFCTKALAAPGSTGEQRCVGAIQHYARPLIESADQARLAIILLQLSLDAVRAVPSVLLLRLGSNLEYLRNYELALRIYRRIWEAQPRHPDSESALLRLGRIMDQIYRNPEQSRYFYSELIRTFPSGNMADEARRSLSTLPFTDTPYR